MSSLEDQYIIQGDHQLEYRFGENINFFGVKTDVKLRMREASLFSHYDELQHSFVVDGSAIPDSMLGLHKIVVEATFVDPKGQTQYFSKPFYLHVEADPNKKDDGEEAEIESDGKKNSISTTDWTGQTMFEPQSESKERPIPYIVDFS